MKRLYAVKTWQLLVMLVIVALVAATLLRLNNLGMVERRQAVIEADESGDAARIHTALVALQRYVATHINTGLDGGVYLEESYIRDRDAAVSAAANSNTLNSSIYNQAAVECRSRFHGGVASYRNDYVQCVVEHVSAAEAGADAMATLQLPSVDRYRFDFASPLWAPDMAGLVMAGGAGIIVVIIVRIVMMGVLRFILRSHYHN